MFDFVRNRRIFYVLSAVLLIPGIISLALPGGLNPGIDFTSGTIMTIQFDNQVEQDKLRQAFAALENRIGLFLSLPLVSLDRMTLQNRLAAIGRRTPSASAA